MISAEDVERLVRPELKAMSAYVPIEPTDMLSQRVEIPEEAIIKLDGNENPYGCSAGVNEALANYGSYHLYPDPEQRELRKALDKYVGLDSKYILAGSGSDELIDLVLRLFVEPGDKVINCIPTFGMYSFSTNVCGGRVVDIPRKPDFSINVKAIKEALDIRTKIIFIASPNNPSGNITPKAEIVELLDNPVLIVIDEAYFEFSGITVASLVPKYPNLIVLRTFSKWAGLAGLRVGYGVFASNIVNHLMKIKQPYNVNTAAQIAAIKSLENMSQLQSTIRAIIAERERLLGELAQFEWLRTYPSQANFILCLVTNGKAREIYRGLQKKGIFIRYFDTPQLKNCLRVSVGKPEHTDALIAAMKEMS